MSKLKDWTEKLKSKKSLPLVIAALLAMTVLFVVCFGGSFDKTSDEPASAQSYIDGLQNKLVSVVVAEGADNPVVKFEIINLVVTLTGVDRDNVRVFAYKV